MDEKTPILVVLCLRRGIWMDLNKLDLLDVILVAGLPGSGKSWFAREYFAGKNRLRINRKEIRKSIYEMSHFGDVWKESYYTEKNEYLVKHVERKIFEQLLSNNEKVLIDNHSVTVESRRPYIETALAARKTIGIVFMHTPVQVCMKRNLSRSDSVPPMTISTLYSALVLPSRAEGFREILVVSAEGEDKEQQG